MYSTSLHRILRSLPLCSAVLLLAPGSAGAADPVITGELREWQPVTVSFHGPAADVLDDAPNPFLDYRLAVAFTNGSTSLTVPGFFDGDGTGGWRGDIWRVRFTPPRTGQWSYLVSFRSGRDVAVDLNPEAGEPAALDGAKGTFRIGRAGQPRTVPDFFRYGLLEYASGFYLKFRRGPYWIKGGTDEPEDFLAYSGFDHTRSGSEFAVTDYGQHVRDWQPGDPDWGDGRGKGIIGALNYLAARNVNLIYFLPMNIGGDGQNVWPFAGRVDPKGSPENDTTHYDVGKLRQWEIVFEHAQRKDIVLHFVLNEAERANKETLGGKTLSRERKLYYREMIARFGHHNALLWNLCEEYNLQLDYGADAVKEFARYIRALDPYRHPLTVHHAREPLAAWQPFIGSELFDLTSLQIGRADIEPVVEKFREATRKSGRPLPICIDEFTVTTDKKAHLPTDDFVTLRKEKVWPAYLSGGQVEVITQDLLDTHDFRKHEQLWNELWYARKFLEENLPFWEMEPADNLLDGEATRSGRTCTHGGQVFAKHGEAYAIYLPQANATGILDLTEAAGQYVQRWYNPRTGLFVGRSSTVTAGQRVALGPPPAEPMEDWAVLIVHPVQGPAGRSR